MSLEVFQHQIVDVVELLHFHACHLCQSVHDGLLARHAVAQCAALNHIGKRQFVAFQLKAAVDGITTIAAIHLIAIFEIKEDIGTLIGVDVDFIYAQNSPFAIELLVGGCDSHFLGSFLACHLVSHRNRHSLLLIHGFFIVGISLCVGVERSEHKANRQSRNYIFFHIIK